MDQSYPGAAPPERAVVYISRPLLRDAAREMSGMARHRPATPATAFCHGGRVNTRDRPPLLCGQEVAGATGAEGGWAPSLVPPTATTSGSLAGQPTCGVRYRCWLSVFRFVAP